MIRALAIVTVSGFIVALVCLGIAGAMAARAVATGDWDPDSFRAAMEERFGGEMSFGPSSGPAASYDAFWEGEEITREFAWNGEDELDVGMPADVTYSQGPAAKVTVTGLSGAVERFSVEEGRLRLRGWSASNTYSDYRPPADPDLRDRPPRLKIAVIAPSVRRFELTGSETLAIDGYNQDRLEIVASGSSRVTAQGAARDVRLDLDGGARADLAALTIETLKADLSDSAEATAGPARRAELDASDVSRIVLTRQPPEVVRHVSDGAMVEVRPGASQ